MALSSSTTNRSLVKGMSCGSTTNSKVSKRSRRPSGANGQTEEQGLFPVEKIIGERVVNGRVHFKIRWQGYSQEEDSWEPHENLGNVSDLIEVFRQRACSSRSKFLRKRKNALKAKTIGRYEYVPQSELVAPKTKYFDDVRDGKIDLTKNDMYSRVKTRKRLHFEMEDEFIDCHDGMYCEDDFQLQKCGILNEPYSPSETAVVSYASTPTTSSVYTNTLLYDIGDVKSEYGHEQVHSPISSISTTGCETEDLPSSSSSSALPCVFTKRSSFSERCDEDAILSSGPFDDVQPKRQYEDPPIIEQNSEINMEKDECRKRVPLFINTTESDSGLKIPHTKKIQRVSPNNTIPTGTSENENQCNMSNSAALSQSTNSGSFPLAICSKQVINNYVCRPFVTSEKDLLRIYANKSSLSEWSPCQLPQLQLESDNVHCISQEELIQAIAFNRWNLFERTVRSGQFSLDKIDIAGTPLLMHTIQRDRVAMLRLLLSFGASPNTVETETGRTPLMLAAELGHLHAVKALLDYGALSDKQFSSQESALSLAIQNGRLSIVELLLAHGTNFYMVDPNHTAINLVTKLKNSRTVDTTTLSKIYDLIYEHHNNLTGAMRLAVNQYLAKLNLRNELVVLPCQWVSVMAGRFEVDLNLTTRVQLESPILLLVHGRQCGSNYLFWMEDGPCLVDRVILNGKVQTPLRESAFVTTLHPMCPSMCSKNKLALEFVAPDSMLDRQVRIAVLAIDVRSLNPDGCSSSIHKDFSM